MDTPAFDPNAPPAERYDAQVELQQSAISRADIVHESQIRPLIDHVASLWQDQQMLKANTNVVPFPSKTKKKVGMQSVKVDDLTIVLNGDFIERPGTMTFDMLRAMVDQTPVLGAVVLTRVRQVNAFCKVQESGEGPGFVIRHIEKMHQLTKTEQESVNLLHGFFQNCGWETDPRRRKLLRRDPFPTLMGKLVRDSLVMDSCAIETEFKRDRSKGIDGLYSVDGSTIRLCDEEGYRGDDEIFALQVIQGQVRTAYDHYDLIYEPRNPRTDVMAAGYGLSETELLIRVVTGFLNAMTLNIRGFSDNSIPRGVLHMTGNYSVDDLAAFKRYWNATVRGINNSWTVPVMISKDQESKASFENFGVEFDEMYFSKWMTFLASIICAVYGIAPDEINFESFSASKSSLSGSDTVERLADSKDKGLSPLLSYYEGIWTDYVLSTFGDKYVFRWTGVKEEDADKRHELKKLTLSVNEVRAQEGYEETKEFWGDAPLNPSLTGAWVQMMQQEAHPDMNGDGQRPPGGGDGGDQDGGGDGGGGEGPGGQQGGEQGQPGADSGAGDAGPAGGGGVGVPGGDNRGQPLSKSLSPDDLLAEALLKANEYGVGVDDEVFYTHPEKGVATGKVCAIGKDGFMVDGEKAEKPAGVLWDAFRGHKKRHERAFHVVDKGESGAVVEDPLTGKRHFLQGEIPEDEDLADEQDIIFGREEPGEKKPLAKSASSELHNSLPERTFYLQSDPPAAPLVTVEAQDMGPLVDGLQKSMTAAIEAQGAAMISALAGQTDKIAQVADSVRLVAVHQSDDLTKALAGALAEERKPVEVNIKLEMPGEKTKRVRRNPDGSMTVEVDDGA